MTTLTINLPVPEHKEDWKVDQNIVSAVRLFFVMGLPPGSCTELLLAGHYKEARNHAHMMIRDDDKWSEHIGFVEHLVPACCKGENYYSWKGYKYMTEEEQEEILVMLTLQLGESLARAWTNTDL